MGRAMLIICAGVMISLGYVTVSTNNSGRGLAQQTSEYAKRITATNTALTAIQIAFNKMNEDDSWAANHVGQGNAWTSSIQGASTTVYLDKYTPGSDFFEPDTIWIVSEATFLDHTENIT